jgi:hypothetical protein
MTSRPDWQSVIEFAVRKRGGNSTLLLPRESTCLMVRSCLRDVFIRSIRRRAATSTDATPKQPGRAATYSIQGRWERRV